MCEPHSEWVRVVLRPSPLHLIKSANASQIQGFQAKTLEKELTEAAALPDYAFHSLRDLL